MGFNMVRKHIKMEPRRWYFHTDTLGLLVWQDVPSKNNRAGLGDPIFDQWLAEMEREVDARAGHPSIVQWVTYNEGWGQTVDDAGATVAHTVSVLRARDTTRLIGDASGGRGCWPQGTNAVWAGGCHGDVTDVHHYSPPDWDTSEIDVSQRDRSKAFVIGEYGGILVSAARAAACAASQNAVVVCSIWLRSHALCSLVATLTRDVCVYLARTRFFLCHLKLTPTGHEWAVGQCNGYATVGDREELAALYAEYNTRIIDMMGARFPALSAAVYTEITDVETECNGLLTYDRLYKADPVRIRAANEALIAQATGMLREAL